MRYYNLIRNLSNWQLYFSAKYGINKADPLIFITRTGARLEVPLRLLHTFKEIFMDECYMKGLEYRKLANPVILDVGANAGYFTIFAASRFPGARIIAFEPVSVNFHQLERNRLLNPGCRIETNLLAISGKTGEMTIYFDANDSFTTNATLRREYRKDHDTEFRVSCITLQEVFETRDIEYCDLLKMDCEGAEYDILYNTPNSIFPRIRQIAMEVHKGPGEREHMESIETFIRGKGFHTCQKPVGMLWAWRGETN